MSERISDTWARAQELDVNRQALLGQLDSIDEKQREHVIKALIAGGVTAVVYVANPAVGIAISPLVF